MISFEPELERLRPQFGDRVTDELIARERREIFSVYPEVRLAAWAGALLVAAAVGLFVKNNFERFDRAFLAAVLGAMALACYVCVWRKGRSVGNDYVLLLGALLLSADVGFIEQQFDIFGEAGARHFLLLAVIHGATAYRFNSRLVLSLSITALAAWMGIERNLTFEDTVALAMRAFACAAVILIWRAVDRVVRASRQGPGVVQASGLPPGGGTKGRPEACTTPEDGPEACSTREAFSRVFEHFAANLALWGGLLLLDDQPLLAAVITTAIAAAVMAWGFRTRVESFVLYAFVYAVIADVGYAMTILENELSVLVGMLIAVPTLMFIHRRFKRGQA